MAESGDRAARAYRAAAAEVRRARAAGETELRLNRPEYAALTRLPDEVEGWRNLGRANLDGTQVADLSPLRGLPDLWSISADDTQVADLSPLRGMTGLRTLWLNRTAVRDLSPLAGMGSLEYLLLDDTLVEDLTPLRGLRRLANLSLRGAKGVTEIAPLADPGGLILLTLDGTGVADIGPVAAMRRLARLSLTRTKVRDLSPVAGLAHMTGLRLSGSEVADLRPVWRLSLLAEDRDDELPVEGLQFRNTAATRLDPELERLSRIEEHAERGRRTLAYLRTLPPWPQPLPWLPAPAVPAVPEAVAAPLQVAVQDGVLRRVVPDDGLGDRGRGLAAEGRRAVLDYLADLADQRARIGNAVPRLEKAMAGLQRALGADYAAMSAVAVGTQGQRVIALAQGVEEVLLREDAADVQAFAAALALFLERFPDWRAYRDEAAPALPADVARALPELAQVAGALRDREAIEPAVPEALEDLRADAAAEPGDAVIGRGLVRSAKNVVAALAGAVVQAWRVAARESRDIGAKWWDLQKKAAAGAGVVGSAALAAQAVGFFEVLGPRLLALSQKVPAEFGWLAEFLGWLARAV